MARGAHDDATLRRYSEAQARLEHAGGWNWRDRASSVLRGLGFRDARPRPAARDVLGRRADARLARSRARRRPRPAAARRADEPPRRREPRVARARADHDRRRRRCSSRTTAGSSSPSRRPCSSSRAAAASTSPGPWHEWRLRAGGARAGRGEVGAAGRRRHRAPRALRGAVPLQEVEGEAGPGEADADRAARAGARARRPVSSRT